MRSVRKGKEKQWFAFYFLQVLSYTYYNTTTISSAYTRRTASASRDTDDARYYYSTRHNDTSLFECSFIYFFIFYISRKRFKHVTFPHPAPWNFAQFFWVGTELQIRYSNIWICTAMFGIRASSVFPEDLILLGRNVFPALRNQLYAILSTKKKNVVCMNLCGHTWN